jgi:hypothetical protein
MKYKTKVGVAALPVSETWALTVLGLGSFAIPFMFGGPQLAIGVAVNAALFLSAFLLPYHKRFAVITAPSVAVLLRGFIFGPSTPFLVFFIPFIWIANLVLTLVFAEFNDRVGFIISVILASVSKFLILLWIARLFYSAQLVPRLFLTAMGSLQLVTALAGGIIAYIVYLWLAKAQKLKRS